MINPFIVLEGLSACGKTTVASLLAVKFGTTVYKTPPAMFESARSQIDKSSDLTARFFFYLAGIIQASVEIQELRKAGPVVCDRYLYTTICYHKAMGVQTDALLGSVSNLIFMPDFTFLVTCNQEERIRRLHGRGLSYNDWVERKSGVEERFLAEYRTKKMIEIDNSCNDPEVAVRAIIDRIG